MVEMVVISLATKLSILVLEDIIHICLSEMRKYMFFIYF